LARDSFDLLAVGIGTPSQEETEQEVTIDAPPSFTFCRSQKGAGRLTGAADARIVLRDLEAVLLKGCPEVSPCRSANTVVGEEYNLRVTLYDVQRPPVRCVLPEPVVPADDDRERGFVILEEVDERSQLLE
jgi:hypothetical protein